MNIIKLLAGSFIFWAAWIVIPLVMEILPAMGSIVGLVRRRLRSRDEQTPAVWPEIVLIVPVYNVADSLEGCIRSVYESTYPNERIRIFLVNNQSTDESFLVYNRCQHLYPQLLMQWMNAEQGKSRALNLALYNSTAKYIINIDSDGEVEPHALENMVRHFENDLSVNCMTGAILTQPKRVENYPRGLSRLLRRLEFMEYAQAFLAGRNYASEHDAIYTLSGAFSGFRKSAILDSWLYSTDTICEDTHITFQMRYNQNEKVHISEDSIFFVEPIESVEKLYIQRQRWQRGSLEVSRMFGSEGTLKPLRLLRDVNVRTLLYDHTFAFPRMIWYLALLCLTALGYSASTVALSTLVIFGFYVAVGYLYFAAVVSFLKDFPEVRRYYRRLWWVVALLPLLNLGIFFVRLAGIINSTGHRGWLGRTPDEERTAFAQAFHEDVSSVQGRVETLRKRVNLQPDEVGKRPPSMLAFAACGVILWVTALLGITCYWLKKTYGVDLNALVITFQGKLTGADNGIALTAVRECLPLVLGSLVLAAAVPVCYALLRRRGCGAKTGKRMLGGMGWGCLLAALCLGVYVDRSFDVLTYLSNRTVESMLYETEYVDPASVVIGGGEHPKNLICIYLESMETTYASTDVGGHQPKNDIPNLTRLAQENVSFSNTNLLGGSHSTFGTGVTVGALFGTTSGVPYALPGEANSDANRDSFASGIVTLGDILAEKGYQQEFLCGSDGNFASRKTYFTQHGGYRVFDYFTAIEEGYIAPDYKVWWGFEDQILFRIAKDEVLRMAAGDQPFNFTMLTVDTHQIGGYRCALCGTEGPELTDDVVRCTDAQTAEFIDWCRQQDFFEDTAIVITGDHPRMDTFLVDGVAYYDRTVYNCFINADVPDTFETKNREFTPLDLFPTILSALGFDLTDSGGRLGLGTDLFSQRETLAEERGFDWLNGELSKRSDYYLPHFAPELVNVQEEP